MLYILFKEQQENVCKHKNAWSVFLIMVPRWSVTLCRHVSLLRDDVAACPLMKSVAGGFLVFNMFFWKTGENRVRRILPSAGALLLVCGSLTGSFFAPPFFEKTGWKKRWSLCCVFVGCLDGCCSSLDPVWVTSWKMLKTLRFKHFLCFTSARCCVWF